ncbi:LLM class F420-dependent oxidoreductase [Streptomyces sulfonofaciens]|uniref:LLM class F420-dependent oxidoreductase n=1 Tax=Streptomyces sulfonofaciens TaxID=68272 RepID=A0A919FXC8_9ACTN|nr:LLM class F420-dependent oxidoreductase [Streptomyces sulfonofaciens]GHH73350.1 LLM class F420-dependent oxidoreductase [Streptomyces sulfonofaciens]
MTEFGYFLSCEEHGPTELVEQARMAEQAGFTALWISDHFHPWNDRQGQSPFVWSVIGALSEAVSLPVETAVTCPTVRMHPVLAAQAAATSSVLLEGRFRLGVGSGEALNESVLGTAWPEAAVRLEMLEEAVQIIRRLFEGEEVSHRGRHYTVQNARLYTVPDQPVPIDVSAFGPQAAEVAGRIGDGFITMQPEPEPIERFRRSGGGTKPVTAGLKVCWALDHEEAVRTAHRLWPNDQLPGELPQVLPTPAHIDQASSLVTPEQVAEHVTCGSDTEAHVASIRRYVDAGFDTVYVNQMGPDQQGFFDFYRTKVLPQLAG